MNIRLANGDCVEKLKKLADNSVDAVVTDPPYGLGKEPNAKEVLMAWATTGYHEIKGKGFMGKEWDAFVPQPAMWKEVFRVLKPGGHVLAFFGTRTYDWGTLAIRLARFEIRDQIQWIYGSGFPKSMNISKAIDKQAGAEREVIEERFKNGNMKGHNGLKNIQAGQKSECNITAPATDDAKKWDGWGTALKPANEPIVLARKPLEKGLTVAENVLKWGTGAINVDGTRIAGKLDGDPNRFAKTDGGWGVAKFHNQPVVRTEGRWPANVLFDEAAAEILDAQQEATSRFFYVAKASKRERNAGCERIITWEGQDQNLQVLTEELNQLAKATSDFTIRKLKDTEWSTLLSGKELTDQCLQDFKFTIKTVTKLITELKTLNYSQRSNINASIRDAIATVTETGLSLAESAEFINLSKKNITNEPTALALGVASAALTTLLKIRELGKQGNVHSTVKPIKLMEYLIKLVTPPGGTVLDPFMGSGSTGVAAVNLERNFLGVELSKEYFDIAKARINKAKSESEKKTG